MQLSGRTDVLPLFDLVQMLSVNEATGMLKVESPEEKGYLYLQGGTVINAMDSDHREGEEAAKHVFALSDAEFTFSPDLPSVAHRIRCTTQSLMMDIARQLDEESVTEGEEPTHGERVRGAQQASVALREIFEQLDQDSRILSLRSHQGFTLADLLAHLADSPGAVLHLREGAPPAVRAGDRSIPVSETPVDARGYGELCDILLRGAVPLGAAGGDPEAFLLAAGSLGRVGVERIRWETGEVLAVRLVPDKAALAEALPWPAERLEELLALPGAIVLVTSATRALLSAAFASACTPFLAGTLGPFLGLARRWSVPAECATTLLLSTLREADRAATPALVDRLDPAVVAVEDSDCRPALTAALRAVRDGGRAMIGVCAASPAHVPHRFLGGLSAGSRGTWTYHLGTGLAAVLGADGTDLPIDAPARAALLAGETGPLVAALTEASPGG